MQSSILDATTRGILTKDIRDAFAAGNLNTNQIERLELAGFAFEPRNRKLKENHFCGHKRPVIEYETGMRFDSIKEAASFIGVSTSNIHHACSTGHAIDGAHYYFPDEHPNGKPVRVVLCIETNETFPNVTAAAKSRKLYGKKNRIRDAIRFHWKCDGHHWRYTLRAV